MIPAIPSIPPIGSATAPAGIGGSDNVGGATDAGGSSFSNVLGNALDSLNSTQQTATDLSLQAATGQASIADMTVASTQADLEVQLVTAIRDKAVDAFNTIMGMQA